MAYLYCKSARYERSNSEIRIFVEIGNAGQSPASQVKIVSELSIYEVGGMRSRPRVLTFINCEKQSSDCQPVNASSSTLECVTFNRDFDIKPRDEEDRQEFSRSVFESGNTLDFEMEVIWRDVFDVPHRFLAFMGADLGPTPTNRMKNWAKGGRLSFQVKDTERVVKDAAPDRI